MPQVTQPLQNHIKTKSSPDMVTAGVAEPGAGEGGVAGLDPKYFVAATPGGTHYRYRFECHQKQFLTSKAPVFKHSLILGCLFTIPSKEPSWNIVKIQLTPLL